MLNTFEECVLHISKMQQQQRNSYMQSECIISVDLFLIKKSKKWFPYHSCPSSPRFAICVCIALLIQLNIQNVQKNIWGEKKFKRKKRHLFFFSTLNIIIVIFVVICLCSDCLLPSRRKRKQQTKKVLALFFFNFMVFIYIFFSIFF